MDRLARNAMLAKQANMSYGKWKALQPIVPIVREETIPEGYKKCELCGKPFKPYKGLQKYCDGSCRVQAYYEKQLEQQRNYRRKKKAEREGKKDE